MIAGVIACGALAIEIRAVADRRGWPLDIHPLSALLHNRPDRISGALVDAIETLKERYDVLAVAYGDCGSQGAVQQVCERFGVSWLRGEHCYDVFAGPEARRALAREPGTYFLTDFLARTFEHTVIRELGLDRHPELRDDYFRHYTRVVWLAQRPTAPTRAAAQRAAGRIGLPLKVLPVGTGGLERELERCLALAEEPGRPSLAEEPARPSARLTRQA